MVSLIFATIVLLSGVYLLMLGIKKQTPKQNMEQLHIPEISTNWKVRYRVVGVLLIIIGLIILLKSAAIPARSNRHMVACQDKK
jgi:hypothetical protein